MCRLGSLLSMCPIVPGERPLSTLNPPRAEQTGSKREFGPIPKLVNFELKNRKRLNDSFIDTGSET